MLLQITAWLPKNVVTELDSCTYFFTGHFLGDIALPDVTYSKKTKEEEDLQAEVEQYKREVLEGLQIEEEGLTDFIRKKTKQQTEPRAASRSYNDPFANFSGFSSNTKNGQILKAGYTRVEDITITNNNNKTQNANNSETATSTDEQSAGKTKGRHKKRHAEVSSRSKKAKQRKRHKR